jgi:3-oxoadipate enol-lactonase
MRVDLQPEGWLEVDDVGQGPVVVLLHAFPLARSMWRSQREALAARYRVLTPDLRGFGDSSGVRGTPSVEAWAADVAALLRSLSVGAPVVLGGLSMGGYVALAFVRKYPDRVRALVLADTRAEADTAEARANRDRTIALARSQPPSAVIEQMLPRLLGPSTQTHRPEVAEEVRRIAGAQSPDGIVAALQALRDRPDATTLLGAITVPTLVLVGDEDALTPPAAAATLTNGIPGARLVLLDKAGHLSNLEQPDTFNAAVLSFLDGLPIP